MMIMIDRQMTVDSPKGFGKIKKKLTSLSFISFIQKLLFCCCYVVALIVIKDFGGQ